MPKKRRPDDYDYFDDLLDELLRYIVKKYNSYKTRALKFDELNALRETKTLYAEILKKTRKLYVEVAWWYYRANKGQYENRYDDDWLMEFLDVFDPITGYQYYPEWERKMYRQYEEVVSQVQAKQSPAKMIDRSMQLLVKQITQKGIEVVDQAVKDAYVDRNIRKVRWRTQEDERVCGECYPRNGKIFRIDKLPKKHYLCRCWLEPVGDNAEDK